MGAPAPLSVEEARAAIRAGEAAESRLRAIARTRRPTEEETEEARAAYALAARGAATLATPREPL